MSPSSRSKNAWSTGPDGLHAVSTIGTGCHGPVASIAAANPEVVADARGAADPRSSVRAVPAR